MITKADVLGYTFDLKSSFVANHLELMLCALYSDVKKISYRAKLSPEGTYATDETVTVDFKDGGSKHINVCGDSCLQMVKDVLSKFI